jgi:hypothetical protein
METGNLSKRTTTAISIVGVVALCIGWSASALSATTTEAECDAVTRDLRVLEVPVEAFSVSPVDHVSIETDPSSDLASLNTTDVAAETSAPFLYLTPRVATVLRGIFRATSVNGDANNSSDVASSPVAESDSIPDISELIDESDSAARVEEIDLPLFQQRMFRTDI